MPEIAALAEGGALAGGEAAAGSAAAAGGSSAAAASTAELSTAASSAAKSTSMFDAGLNKCSNSLSKFGSNLASGNKNIFDMIGSISTLSNKWLELQQVAFESARSMASSRKVAMRMDRQLMEEIKMFGRAYGTTYEEIAEYQKNYSQATSRNIQLTRQQMEQMIALGNVTDNATASKLVEQFDNIGVSVEDTLAYTGQLQERAKYLGLNAIKASETLSENINLAAKASFKNGVDDIQRMVVKSQSLKMNMQSIMDAADKMSTIQGSIETSANIQMLGGSFASQFSDPMKVLYESMADPAALQDRILKVVEGKAKYDKKTNQVSFDPLAMAQMKQYAKELGMNIEDLTKPAMAMAQNAAVDKEMRGNWSNEQKTAIENLARANFDTKTGKHYVNIIREDGNTEKVNVEDLTQKQLEQAQDSAMTQDKMWSDVHAIKEFLVKGTMRRSRQNRSGLENLGGYGQSVKGWAAQLENYFMPIVSGVLNGANSGWANGYSMLGNMPMTGKNGFYSGSIIGPDGLFEGYANGGVIKSVQHANNGTVVGGDEYYGDNVPIMANSGEIVINRQQQNGLMSLLRTLGKTAFTTIGGNIIGKKLGLGNIGTTGLAMSALGGGDMMSSMLQIGIAKKYGALGGMVAGMDPVSALLFGGGFGKGKKLLGGDSKATKGSSSSSILDYLDFGGKGKGISSKEGTLFNKVIGKSSKLFDKFNDVLGASASKLKGFGGKIAGVGSKFGFISKSFGKVGGLIGKFTGKFGSIFSKFGGKIGSGLSAFSKVAMHKGRNIALDGALRFGKAKDFLSRSGSKALGFLKESSLVKNGASEASSLVKSVGGASSFFKSGGGKLLGGVGKFFKSGGGKLLGGVGKKIPLIGTLISAGMAVGGLADASSNYDARKSDIMNSNMSDSEKKKALEDAEDEKRGEQGKAIGSAVGSGVGMAVGGSLGSFAGPIGTAIGGAVGGFLGEKVGGAIGSLAKPLSKMTRSFSKFLFGDKDKKAEFTDEELSDPQLSAKADAATIKIYELMLQKENGGIIGKAIKGVGEIATAPLKLAAGAIGGIGKALGGVESPEVASLPVVGEKTTIKNNNDTQSSGYYGPSQIGPQDINLNVSGTIKLDVGGRQTGFDVNSLLNSPQFKSELAAIISKRFNEVSNAGKTNKEGKMVNTQKIYNKIR